MQPMNDGEENVHHTDKMMNYLIQRWHETIRPNLKRSAQDSCASAFRRTQPVFGSVPVSRIEKADVQWFLTKAGKTLAGKSVRNLGAHLSGVLSVAEDRDWLTLKVGANLARRRPRLPAVVPVRPRRVLLPEDLCKLLAVLAEPCRTVVLLAVLSGIRKGKLAAWRWDDVKPGYSVIDEAECRGELNSPKSHRSRREVSIGPAVQKALETWRGRTRFSADRDFVFSIVTNSPIELHNALTRRVRSDCEKTGVPLISWHNLGQTYTAWSRKSGVQAESMRDQLGHASVLMTLDVYSRAADRTGIGSRVERYGYAGEAVGVAQTARI